jgi:hypothetical protein
MRVARIRTVRQAEIEERREALRDRRWARRQSMIGMAGRWALAGFVALSIDFHATPNLLLKVVALL